MTCDLRLLVVALVALICGPSSAWSYNRAHETSYDIGGPAVGGSWTSEGSAQLSEAGADLTQSSGEYGSIWNEKPVNFSNWELELDFAILRSRSQKRHADGFGLFYVRDPKLGGTFGTISDFVGLGIVFDTFRNGAQTTVEPPYLQVHVLDGSVPHMWQQDGLPTALVNIHAPVLEKSNSKLTVKYQNDALAVTLRYREDNVTEWTKQEFRIQDVRLPKEYFFGLGATCGLFCSNHRVLGFKVYSLDGPGHSSRSLPQADSDGLFEGNEYVRWNTFGPGTVSSSAVVLGYTMDARPVFFARVVDKGPTVPVLYIPSLNKDKLYAFPNDKVTVVEAKDAQVLSYRFSRSSHLLWQQYPTEKLELEEFRKRLVAVGYSNEGDVLYICRSEPQNAENPSERVPSSGLGVFSISTGVCRYVNQIDSTHFEVRTTPRFSMSLTLPTDAS